MIIIPANSPSTAYTLQKSLRFRASASANLTRTFTTPTSSTVFTWSGWVKRGLLGTTQYLFGASTTTNFGFNSSNQLVLTLSGTTAATTSGAWTDPSGWYHVVYVQNGSSQTIYVNSVSRATGTTANTVFNTAIAHQTASANSANYFDGYLAEVNFIDGQALTPTSFGSFSATTGVWQPAKYSGTYGTNGFYLPFSNTASTTTLGYDLSGNSNNWTTNNISLTTGSTYDSMTDVPTLTSATASNYAVLNPLDANTNLTITNGNLQGVSASTWYQVRATIGMNTGKWYWECVLTSASPAAFFGIGTATASLANSNFVGSDAYGWSYYSPNGQKYNAGTNTSYGSSFTQNDVIGIAFDAGAGTLTFYKNNVSQGTAYTGLTGFTYFPMFSVSNSTFVANFGQQPFTYTPPTGFVALNAYNLPTGTILQGSTAMNATLQLGSAVATGATLFAQTGFTYGLAWGKDRTSSNNHQLVDTVRGTSNVIQSNTTAAETTYTAPTSTDNMVTWGWNAGSSAVTNTNGSITSTVSVNASAGFSVVTYTGTGANATVGHGLGVAPQFIFVKYRNGVIDWRAYHSSIGNTNFLVPNTNVASAASSATWNNTSPTSSVFSIGTALNVNNASANYVAYCWAAISGFSAFGSYTGNGSASGPFIYCGFQPKYILFKRTDSAESWLIKDTARNPYNSVSSDLYVDLANAEDSSWTINVTANGFQLTSTGAMNASGGTYIYAAFASNPFKNSLAF